MSLVGAVIGDIFGYFLGKNGSRFLLQHKKILKSSHVEEGKKFLVNHGIKSILIGRFIGPIRPIISLIAGSSHMKFSKFIFYDILAAFLWSYTYLGLGFYFGNYVRQIERIASRISIVLTLLCIFALAFYYFKIKEDRKKTYEN